MIASEHDNLPQWGGQSGWHEAYSLTINDAHQGVALWIRYVLFAPCEGEPGAELWGIAFNGGGPGKHVAIRETLPMEQVRLTADSFAFQIGRALLTNHSARGRIENHAERLGWVISWQPNEAPFRYFPNRAFYDGPYPPTKALAPNPLMRVTGEVLFNRRRIELTDAAGFQEHSWGTKFPLGGVRAHCLAFEDDPTVEFQGFSETPKKLGPLEPHLSVFRFRVDGEERVANGLYRMFTTESRHDVGGWFFAVTCGDMRFEGSIEAPFGRMVGVVYQDPDGELAYGYHTAIADMTLRVFVKGRGAWKLDRELFAPASCAMAVLTRTPDPEIALLIEEPAQAGR